MNGFDIEKVANKFELDKTQIVNIELQKGKYTDYDLVVWLEQPRWNNPDETEVIDSVHHLYAGEVDHYR